MSSAAEYAAWYRIIPAASRKIFDMKNISLYTHTLFIFGSGGTLRSTLSLPHSLTLSFCRVTLVQNRMELHNLRCVRIQYKIPNSYLIWHSARKITCYILKFHSSSSTQFKAHYWESTQRKYWAATSDSSRSQIAAQYSNHIKTWQWAFHTSKGSLDF